MWQRVLQATIITVVLAVLMLGIPLGWSWLQLAEQRLYAQANEILDDTRNATDARLNEGRPLDEAMLQNIVDQQTDLNIQISVIHDGTTVSAGEPPGNDPLSVRTNGVEQQQIAVDIPKSDVRAHTASAWVLMAVAGLAALSIGASVALWQAQRISMPLARLNRRAEEMGSGRARGPWSASGISEIDDVAEELIRSGALLTERLEAESQLASNASHQLRTPLTALSMRLDEILATSSEEWVREEARISLDQIDRLTEVVHDLINAPRSSARRSPGVVELRSMLTQQSEEWSPAYRRAQRELRIQVPRSAAVWGSTGPLTQVIATLIENALMHGEGRTTVKVRRNEHSTVIEVTDEGGGIDSALGTRIFERSVSGRSSSGTGVGLALARTLVEDDGGRLELLTENPAKFGVFLISAPGEDDDVESESGDHQGDVVSDDFGTLPQGSVVRRRPHSRA
ncbi:HAMP domain-containing sensor histidine kinase [Brachybacterium sp. FME24]|uniref:sensor histidine kinase n=1 Tax=Brachybacterium sp. FME24 TaxID=2742605 RepID=UPI0018682F3D|nr:HAMP domain-containing sensor histidine kinase [Brachybacterium sp. FME24]